MCLTMEDNILIHITILKILAVLIYYNKIFKMIILWHSVLKIWALIYALDSQIESSGVLGRI